MGLERPPVARAAGRYQRLADHLAAEDPLPADLRAASPEQVVLELLEVEDGEKIVDGARHGPASGWGRSGTNARSRAWGRAGARRRGRRAVDAAGTPHGTRIRRAVAGVAHRGRRRRPRRP